jgi:hypothetical protein
MIKLFAVATRDAVRTNPPIIVRTERDPVTSVALRSLIETSCKFLDLVSEEIQQTSRIFLQRDYPSSTAYLQRRSRNSGDRLSWKLCDKPCR